MGLTQEISGIFPTSLLGNGGVFTSIWYDATMNNSDLVSISSFSDQASAALGVVVQESDDTTNANLTRQIAAVAAVASTLLNLYVTVRKRFWRIIYTNGVTPQTQFELTFCADSAVSPPVDPVTGVPVSEGAALGNSWSGVSTPAVSTQATFTKAAAAGVQHVCTSISATLAAVAAQTIILLNLRDSTTGAGTILWSKQVVLPIGAVWEVSISGLNIPGTRGNAMTLEFSAAPVGTNYESVDITGYDA